MPNKISAIKQVITPKTPVILWVVCLLCLAMVSTSLVIKTAWHDPFAWLCLPSQSLSLNQMVVQLQLIPTIFVAMLSGGLLGVASVLLQQLVKNNLASDTTLAVGSGAELSLLIVAIVAPSFGLHGSFWVAAGHGAGLCHFYQKPYELCDINFKWLSGEHLIFLHCPTAHHILS